MHTCALVDLSLYYALISFMSFILCLYVITEIKWGAVYYCLYKLVLDLLFVVSLCNWIRHL